MVSLPMDYLSYQASLTAARLIIAITGFLPRDATQSAVMPQYVVCLSATLRQPIMFFTQVGILLNTVAAEQLKASDGVDPNMGDLGQRKHPQNQSGIGLGSGAQKTCNISETVQDRTNVTVTDQANTHLYFAKRQQKKTIKAKKQVAYVLSICTKINDLG